MRSTCPLAKLYLSDRNVRKTGRDLDVAPLADNIAAKGLLQQLAVADEGRGDGMLGVVGGGRRCLALKLLEEKGWRTEAVDRDAIPIEIRPVEEAREISLSENVRTVAMNAADEVEAYAAIVGEYETQGEQDPEARIARCAQHFGKSVRYVEQRLRLAGLVPAILDALREGAITLDAAKAYAVVADPALQAQVFAAQERQGQHSVAGIRAAYAGLMYRVGDRQVRFVGADAYVAAGGRIQRDLFMGSELDQVLLDTELLDRLAREKGEREAVRIAVEVGYAGAVLKGWGAAAWQRPRTPDGFQVVYSLAALRPPERADVLAIATIAQDGGSVELTDEGFRPQLAPLRASPSPTAPGAASGRPLPAFMAANEAAPAAPGPDRESEIQRLGRIRREKIESTALRLAMPRFEGTPLEGRVFLPPADQRVLAPRFETEESIEVAVYIRIPKLELDRFMGEAEALVDHELEGREPPPARTVRDDFDEPPLIEVAASAPPATPEESASLTVHELADLIAERMDAFEASLPPGSYDHSRRRTFAEQLIDELVEKHGARFRHRPPDDHFITLGGVQRSCTSGSWPLLRAWVEKVKSTAAYQARAAAPAPVKQLEPAE